MLKPARKEAVKSEYTLRVVMDALWRRMWKGVKYGGGLAVSAYSDGLSSPPLFKSVHIVIIPGTDEGQATRYASHSEVPMSLSRHFSRVLTLPALLMCFGFSTGAQEGVIDYNRRIVELLEGYQELMNIELEEDVRDLPRQSWSVAGQAIEKGFLRFTVDPARISILEGARFRAVPGSETTHIVFTQNILDAWGTNPSLSYSVFTRAVRDASMYFLNPESWTHAQGDPMEKLLIRVEGYGVEAELIRDRLIASGYNITPYEAYVLNSFEKDNLASLTLFLEKASLIVARGLYDARVAFEVNENAGELRTIILDLGSSLLEARNGLPSISSDKEIYPMAVGHPFLAGIHTGDDRPDPQQEPLGQPAGFR